jgi:hypothetical protein
MIILEIDLRACSLIYRQQQVADSRGERDIPGVCVVSMYTYWYNVLYYTGIYINIAGLILCFIIHIAMCRGGYPSLYSRRIIIFPRVYISNQHNNYYDMI